jgi:hypothetical protein
MSKPDDVCRTREAVLPWLKKWLWCSWVHRKVWTQMNKLGDYKWVKVGGRCYPHVWHECEYWHCYTCHPCGDDLRLVAASEIE